MEKTRQNSLKLLYKKIKKHLLRSQTPSKKSLQAHCTTVSQKQQPSFDIVQREDRIRVDSVSTMADSCISISSISSTFSTSTAGNTVDLPRYHDVAALPIPVLGHRTQCASASATCTYSDSTSSKQLPQPYLTVSPVHHVNSADSGLCSDDELEDGVFVDEEDALSLLEDDGWQIAAGEVSLDRVIVSTSNETVYR